MANPQSTYIHSRKMARGKIQIKRIENVTNRQVTYSKRRNGLKKKAHELTVLCDAKVSLLMVSSSGKLFEFVSQSTTTKQMLDEYQKDRGIDIWKSHYEAMQQKLKELEEMNKNLRRQIGQRLGVGDCLNDLDLVELHTLEQEMDEAVTAIRNRKIKHLSNQIDTKKKKLRNAKQFNSLYEYEFEAMDDELQYELAANARDYYESVYSPNQDPRNLFSLRLHAQGSLHPRSGGGSDITTYNLL